MPADGRHVVQVVPAGGYDAHGGLVVILKLRHACEVIMTQVAATAEKATPTVISTALGVFKCAILIPEIHRLSALVRLSCTA